MPHERIAPELVERIPLDQLVYLQGNANKGDRARIREFLTTLGQQEALVINRGTHTGVPNEIVGGNNRVAVMRDLGWTEAAVTWVDVPDRITLNKIALALNKARENATWDERALADIVAGIAAESDLLGTGFDDDSYAELMRSSDLFGDSATDFLDDLDDGLVPDEAAPAPAPAAPAPAAPSSGSPSSPAAGAPTPAAPVPSAPASGPQAGAGDTPAPSGDPTPDPAPQNVSNGYVTVAWTMLPEERDIVRDAIKNAQGKWQTGTAANALVMLCDDYLRRQAVTG